MKIRNREFQDLGDHPRFRNSPYNGPGARAAPVGFPTGDESALYLFQYSAPSADSREPNQAALFAPGRETGGRSRHPTSQPSLPSPKLVPEAN